MNNMKSGIQEMNRRGRKVRASDLVGGGPKGSGTILSASGTPIAPQVLREEQPPPPPKEDATMPVPGSPDHVSDAMIEKVISEKESLQDMPEEEAREVARIIVLKRRREAVFLCTMRARCWY